MPNYKILLVDYEPRSIEAIRGPLQASGHDVEVANDGVKGMEAFHRLKPDLTLIEAMIPKKHGFEVCRELKQTPHGKTHPIVILTAVYKGRKYQTQARHLYGCDDYLEKPVPERTLLAAVERLLPDDSADAAPATATPAGAAAGPTGSSSAQPGTAARSGDVPSPPFSAPVDRSAEIEILQRLEAILPEAKKTPHPTPPAPPPVAAAAERAPAAVATGAAEPIGAAAPVLGPAVANDDSDLNFDNLVPPEEEPQGDPLATAIAGLRHGDADDAPADKPDADLVAAAEELQEDASSATRSAARPGGAPPSATSNEHAASATGTPDSPTGSAGDRSSSEKPVGKGARARFKVREGGKHAAADPAGKKAGKKRKKKRKHKPAQATAGPAKPDQRKDDAKPVAAAVPAVAAAKPGPAAGPVPVPGTGGSRIALPEAAPRGGKKGRSLGIWIVAAALVAAALGVFALRETLFGNDDDGGRGGEPTSSQASMGLDLGPGPMSSDTAGSMPDPAGETALPSASGVPDGSDGDPHLGPKLPDENPGTQSALAGPAPRPETPTPKTVAQPERRPDPAPARSGPTTEPAREPARPTPKPTPKPVARSATRPAPKPTPKPSTEPATRPAPKPTPKPSTEPATRTAPKPTPKPAATRPQPAPARPTPEPSAPAESEPEPAAARVVWTGMLARYADLDVEPKLVTRIEPVYPRSARKKKQQGVVKLNVLISHTGKVLDVKLLQPIADSELNQAAIDAVRGWTYTPAEIDSYQVRVWKTEDIRFRL